MNPCEICSTATKNKCSNCNQRFYCSVEHQKQDWRTHKPNCHPFKVEHNEELGRYLVATRNIKPSEIILKDSPLVMGPSQITGPVCLTCLTVIDPENYTNCEKCGWPMCCTECQNSEDHRIECEFTIKRGHKVNIQEFTNPHPLYQCLSTLRALLLQRRNPAKWAKFMELQSLEQERRASMQWKADLQSIGKFIPKFFNTQEFDEDAIMRAVGILQVNGHEVPTTDPPHVAVYYAASLLEHNCTPNLAKSFTANGDILLWAPQAIPKGAHLSICYSDAVWGTADRQRHLLHTKLFRCQCNRCCDVTELGTLYDGLKCEDKECYGLALPSSLKEWNDNWQCQVCHKEMLQSYVVNILEKAGTDLHAMEKTRDNCLKYIRHYEKWLPRVHYFISEVKIQLVQQIGKDPKELMIVPDELLGMKIEYARELIDLYKLLAPCEIRMLGMLCFELHSAIAENTRRLSLQMTLSPKNLLEESLQYVEQCVEYLQHESDIFIEGHILKQAKINRDALKMVIRM